MLEAAKRDVDGSEATAAANIAVFVEELAAEYEVREVAATRAAGVDGGGRYGFELEFAGGYTTTIRMPGVPLALVREDLSTAAPMLYVDGLAWWWASALRMAAATSRGL